MKKTFLFLLVLLSVSSIVYAQVNHSVEGHEEIVDIVFFYGEGCPHCNQLEEFLDEEIKPNYDVYVVGYEVYFNETNIELGKNLASKYGDSFRGVPMTFIGDSVFVGFSSEIGEQIEEKIILCSDECCDSPLTDINGVCAAQEDTKEKLTIAGVVALAIADSINPCALAVLTMALVALLVKDPSKKKNVLYGGLAFTLAVFVTYLIYGGIIIQFFKFLEVFFVAASKYVRIIFAVLAILLGALNIRDYFKYKPGSIGTEMPMIMRPIAKNLIKNITRPRGAFIIGIFVTLFLLPCTIGPYLVVGNLLSAFEFLRSMPWLILYNVIFVLPMLGITLLVYFGYTSVEKVSGWKEENIKYLHLGAGAVLVLLGIAMLIGWI